MDLEFYDTKGKELGPRKAPMPPRRGEIVLLPPPFPEGEEQTATMDAAAFKDPVPYLVRQVIWDVMAQEIKLVVEPTELPASLKILG